MQPSGTTGAVEGASSVFCVLVVSRNGRVMVNYWAGDPEAKSPSPVEGEWDTPGVAKLVVGYQVLLRFPDTAEMGLGDTALCCVANGAHSTVVLVAAVPPCGTPPATHGLLAAAAHLSNIFENRHRNLLEQQAGEEQDQRQQDAAMSSQQVLRDSDTQGPRMPPTDAEFIPFESAIRATLFDASASLPGMARGAVVPGTLCATAFNVLSGASIFDFTNPEAVAPPLHAPAGDAVRHPFDTGITASDWYLLRGLYAPGSGVLWRAAQQMCLKHHSEMAGKVERITFVGAAGAEVDCVVRLERVLQAGEVVVAAVAAFMSGGGAGGRCAKPADYLDAFAVSFPLRSVERREIAPDSQQHRAFEASTSGMQALPKPQQHQDVGSGGGGGAKPPAALRPAPPPGGNPLQYALILVSLVERAHSLRGLDVSGIGLTNHHTLLLLDALLQEPHRDLAALDLRGSTMGFKGGRLLLSVVEACPKLVRVGLDTTADAGASTLNKIRAALLSRGGSLQAPTAQEWRLVAKMGRITTAI